MQDFSYYLTRYIEGDFNFFMALLDDSKVPEKPNGLVVSLGSAAATTIPLVGKAVGSGLQKGVPWLHKISDRKDSKRLADLVYFQNNNKEQVRKMIIEAAIETFFCFEYQFRNLTSKGGPRRAMQKLAKDTAHRILTYLIKNKQDTNITKDDFSKGVINGTSLLNKCKIDDGKTVRYGTTEWKTLHLYTKVGLFVEESNEFFKNRRCDCKTYGYRRLFPWEKVEEVRKKRVKVEPVELNLILKKEDLEGLFQKFRDYIIKQNVDEKAEFDRNKNNEEAMNDRQIKHDEALRVFLETNSDVIREIARCYQQNECLRLQQDDMALIMKQQMELEDQRHQNVDQKLTDIHCDVRETKEKQTQIEKNTEEILEAVQVTKNEGNSESEHIKEGVTQAVDQLYMGFVNTVHSNPGLKKLVLGLGNTFNVKL